MHNYKIKKTEQYGYILIKDGLETTCPYKQPIPTQSNLGQIQIIQMPCCTKCPHAEVTLSSNINFYSINCGAKIYEFDLTIENENENKIIL
jgi:hypothetical protein